MKFLMLLLAVSGIECALRDKAKKIYIGTAITKSEMTDSQDNTMTGQQFNMLTPGNEMKWDATEYTQGQKNYASADQIVSYAQQKSMRIRGHCLVWHSQLPNWVNGLSKTNLKNAMESRIRDIVGHYKGKLYAWDVVNEVFEGNGQLRDSIWSRNFGESFIGDAFRLARQVDSSVKLYINDYSIETINAKSTGLYNLVKKLRSEGVPIDGVGFQTHLTVGDNLSSFQANLQRFAALGVDVAITEADVKIRLPSNNNTLQQQAADYSNIFKSCEAVSKCVGVTIWGFTDKHSWIPQFFSGYGDALLWDKNYQPKPSYYAVDKVLT